MKQEVLVFGGGGFLGFYLVEELLKKDYSVTVADISIDIKFGNHIKTVRCDISDQENVDKVFENKKFDIVYNLAGFANLDLSIKFPIKTMQLNVLGNMYIINACVKHKISKYIFASSAYAMSNKGSFYGISKLASEKIIEEYNTKYDFQFIILRYGSVYSQRNYDNNYIYNLVKEAVLNKIINHSGDGNEIREYIHAADAAKLSVDVIEQTEFDNTHVILTGTERMKRAELFNMIKEILNNDIQINYNDSEYTNHYKYTPYSFEPSVSKKLVANPRIDMGQGILECIRSVYKNEKK